MRTRISAGDLGRELQDILDRVYRRGDSFLIEREGEAIAALEPVPAATTWSDLAQALRDVPGPDADFAADLEDIQSNQPVTTSRLSPPSVASLGILG
jgi:antitoxin (DNA-binding transcriptional repressor) of toxin-antitoxin stability system